MMVTVKRRVWLVTLTMVFPLFLFGQKNSTWNVDGKKHLVGAQMQLYYPSIMGDLRFQSGIIQPGLQVNYRYLQSPKKEWDLSLDYSRISKVEDTREVYNWRAGVSNEPQDFKMYQTGINIGKRYYSLKKNKGIAPMGRYWYFGIGYRVGKLTTVPRADSIALTSSNLRSFNIDIGFGKEFFINDKIAISFSAHTRPGYTIVTGDNALGNSDSFLQDLNGFLSFRNLLIANYGVTFFLD